MIDWNDKAHIKNIITRIITKKGWKLKSEHDLGFYVNKEEDPRLDDGQLLLTKIMTIDSEEWSLLGFDEDDRISLVLHLNQLGCPSDLTVFLCAAEFQKPLTLKLVKALHKIGSTHWTSCYHVLSYQNPTPIDVMSFLLEKTDMSHDVFNDLLSLAVCCQDPLTLELTKLLARHSSGHISRDSNGWDALTYLTGYDHEIHMDVVDFLLTLGCKSNLYGCKKITLEHEIRFNHVMRNYNNWKEKNTQDLKLSLKDKYGNQDDGLVSHLLNAKDAIEIIDLVQKSKNMNDQNELESSLDHIKVLATRILKASVNHSIND